MTDDARFGIGGNHPPIGQTAEIARFLAESEIGLLTRRDELLAGVAKFQAAYPVIEDDEAQGNAGDFAKQIQQAIKQAKDAFVVAKKPFLDGGRTVDQFFKTITEPLEAGLAEVRRPMSAYAVRLEEQERAEREEAARRAREEAERMQRALAAQERASSVPPAVVVTIEEAIIAADAAEQAQVAATAKAADLTRNRGNLGSVSSLREHWDVEVDDITKVPAEYLMFDYAKARRAVSGGKLREIPGCRVYVRKEIVTR